MAVSFSPSTQIRSISHPSNPQKSLVSFTVSSAKFPTVSSWSSSSSYVKLQVGAKGFSWNPLVISQPVKKRNGVLRCATVDEIEKEKSKIEKDIKERMEKSIENVKTSFNSLRTGRANPAMLDKVEVTTKKLVKGYKAWGAVGIIGPSGTGKR